jgi:hypothetical protein
VQVLGTSPISVEVQTGDLDGDGFPDRVTNVQIDRVKMSMAKAEAEAVAKWESDTDAAALKEVPFSKHFSFLWFTPDGSDYRLDFDATLISASPTQTGIEVVIKVHAVKFSRDALRG